MSDKCEHNSGTVLHEFPRFSIIKCDCLCGEYLIEIKILNNIVRTYTADDIVNRDAELEELRERLSSAEGLLWEMTENPKFGLSSYGMRRINEQKGEE